MEKSKHTIWGKSPYISHHLVSIDGGAYSLGSSTSYAKQLNPAISSGGYPQIQDGHIHRLMGLIFIPRVVGKDMICHKDDIKTNNTLENLYWGDGHDNMQDASRNGKCYSMPLEWIEAAATANLRKCTITNYKETKSFNSMQEAASYIGCDPSSLSQAIRTGGRAYGYQITKHKR